MLTYEPRPGDAGTKKIKTDEQKLKGLGEKSFSSFTREEIDEMREAIEKLVRKLKNIVSRRYALRNRGSIDVKKTLRASAKYNGVPVEIQYRRRAKRKSRIVTLCDVDDKRGGTAFEQFPKAKRYRDFRRLLDQEEKNIDAVVVATPDHVHIPARAGCSSVAATGMPCQVWRLTI